MQVLKIDSELRRFQRRALSEQESRLDISVRRERDEEVQHGALINLGEGGVAVSLERSLVPRASSTIQFRLSAAAPAITAQGRVVWAGTGGRCGIEFVYLPDNVRRDIRAWVQGQKARAESEVPYPASVLSNPNVVRPETAGNDMGNSLHLLAERMRMALGASGVAIALGDRSGMECRAGAGLAPEVGARLRPDSGLTGLCLRMGGWVHCPDVLSDPRVDAQAARDLQTRAITVAPILSGDSEATSSPGSADSGTLIGLLEVLWPEPGGSLQRNRERLQPLVEAVSSAISLAETIPSPERETRAVLSRSWLRFSPLHWRAGLAHWRTALALLLAVWALGTVVNVLRHQVQSRHHSGIPVVETRTTPGPGVVPESPASAASLRPTIHFIPASVKRRAGSTFSVDLMLEGAHDLSSVPLQIVYDPKLVQFTHVSGSAFLGQDGQTIAMVHRDNEAAGTLSVAASRPPSAPGVSGHGVVFSLTFFAKTPGASALSVKRAALRDAAMRIVWANSSQAAITILP